MGFLGDILHEDDPDYISDVSWKITDDTFYVDIGGPELTTSLFDDPDRLREDWQAVLDDRRFGNLSPGDLEEVYRRVETFNHRAGHTALTDY